MSKEKGAVDERSLLPDNDDEQHPDQSISNADAVSVSNTSLSKALEIQHSAIVETLTENLGKNESSTSKMVSGSDCPSYKFKHEGRRIQFNFNQNHLNKLSEIEEAVRLLGS